MYVLTNMITDPEFTKGYWNIGGLYTVDGYSCKMLTGSSSVVEKVMISTNAYYLNNTHRYYMRYYTYHPANTSSEWESLSTQCYWPIAEPCFMSGTIGPANTWKMISGINTRSSFATGNHELRLDWNNERNNFPVWFSRMMLIDLTETFGDKASSITKEMMDSLPFFTHNYKIPSICVKANDAIEYAKNVYIKSSGAWKPVQAHQLYKKTSNSWSSEVSAPINYDTISIVGTGSIQTVAAFDATDYTTLSFGIQMVASDNDRIDGHVYFQDSSGTNINVLENLSSKPSNWGTALATGLGWTGDTTANVTWYEFTMDISSYTGNCKLLVHPASGYSYKIIKLKIF